MTRYIFIIPGTLLTAAIIYLFIAFIQWNIFWPPLLGALTPQQRFSLLLFIVPFVFISLVVSTLLEVVFET